MPKEVVSGRPVIRIKRVYEPTTRRDGRRVLVERLWPRGLTKAALAADAWMKDVAPSPELRKWFAHRIDRWVEFRRRYERELKGGAEAWAPLLEAGARGALTLLYSARDREHNAAVVLRDFLVRRGRRRVSARKRAAAGSATVVRRASGPSRRRSGRSGPR
ncbi:MAG: DUF488 family protein [Deltaproteobacteria bacterium]|nr:DUF488 family protein [Deltaproteobacteria bacterium]